VKTLTVFKASELQVLPLYRYRRRFENVETVEILCFIEEVPGTHEQRLNIGTIENIVSFRFLFLGWWTFPREKMFAFLNLISKLSSEEGNGQQEKLRMPHVSSILTSFEAYRELSWRKICHWKKISEQKVR